MHLRLRFLFTSVFTCWRSVNYNKIYLGEKVRHTFLCNIRTVIRMNQPHIGRKKRMLQPRPEKRCSYEKRVWLLNEMRDYLRCAIFWTLAISVGGRASECTIRGVPRSQASHSQNFSRYYEIVVSFHEMLLFHYKLPAFKLHALAMKSWRDSHNKSHQNRKLCW